MSNDTIFQLRPGRSCGACTACCIEPTIDSPELKKPPGVRCPSCTGKGCAVYEARPAVCREYHCLWRMTLLDLGEEWRPDRSGVMVVPEERDIPPGFEPFGYRFDLIGPPSVGLWPAALTWDPLVILMATAVELNIPVFLGVPAPPGHTGRKMFMNYAMVAGAKAHNLQQLRDALIAAYQEGVHTPSPEIVFAEAV
ncbi:MAG: YkgJ family cysteine cluster protein [Alphaproteobacteria bacterium]|nr:YkgJ family cysteine cluster protein [Alphaproteobacteria bacterium]